ncbi:MAG: hypothetical protein U0Z17_07420 [Bacteroidales bacterium]
MNLDSYFCRDCGNKAEQVSVTYTWTMDAVKPIISTAATVMTFMDVTQPWLPRYYLNRSMQPGNNQWV